MSRPKNHARSPIRVTVRVDRRFRMKVDGPRELTAGTTVAELLESLGIGPAVPAVVLVDGEPRPADYVLLADERIAVVPPKNLRDELVSWAKAIGVAFLIWVVLRSYLIEAFRIPSASMENTLLVGDFLFVNKAIYGGELEIPLTGIHFLRVPGYGTPRRDQVVVFRSVEDSTPNLNIVKRIIGGPGDTLQMTHDTVIRNGRRLDEPYALHLADGGGEARPAGAAPEEDFRLRQIRAWQLPRYVGRDTAAYHPTTHDWGPIVIPPDHYFVMGDNRDESYDSRFWGFLPRAHIRGKPLFIYMSVARDPFRIRWNRIFRHPS